MNNTKQLKRVILFLCFFAGILNAQAQSWSLVWSDEFDSPTLNLQNWKYEVNGGGGGNNELQYYTDRAENLRMEDGVMVIEARKENYLGDAYTSARINSAGKVSVKYGKIEARLKLPYGKGIWPAFWMLGENISPVGWPSCGEIDIMEMVGGAAGDRTTYSTLHWGPVTGGSHPSNGSNYAMPSGRFADDFHIFTTEWDNKSLKTYFDGILYYSIDLTPASMAAFHKNFFIILNLAVGGNWPGAPDATTIFPQKYYIDYVRLYASILGEKEVVKGQSGLVYSLQYNKNTKYDWTFPSGVTVVGETDTCNINVNWGCEEGTVFCNAINGDDTVKYSYPVSVKDYEISGTTFFVPATATNYTFSIPAMTGATYNWTVPGDVTLNSGQGTNSINVTWDTNPGTVSLHLVNTCDDTTLQRPMLATGLYPYPNPTKPNEIPGSIESVNFDYGGEGLAYHDSENANQGNSYRLTEGVDMEAKDGGDFNVGWTIAGEWLKYTVKVNTPGEYFVEIRNASNTGGGKIDISFNNEVKINDYTFGNTGGWGSFVSSYLGYITLDAEDTVMKYDIIAQDVNIGKISFWEKDLVAPSEASNLVGTPIVNKLILSWNPATDNQKLQGYKILLNGTYVKTSVDTFCTITGLTHSTQYEVGIVPIDIQGNIADTLKGSYIWSIDDEAPSMPPHLNATPALRSMLLTWGESVDNYEVQNYKVFVNGVLKTTVTDTLYNLTALTTGTIYNIGIVAVDLQGNSSDTLKGSFSTLSTSIEPLNGNEFEIYPNPVSDVLNIKLGNERATRVVILNPIGQVINVYNLKLNENELNINVSTLNSGLYYVIVNNHKGNMSAPFIKR
jgi:beta-glucanase (GH16 family)